MSLTINLKGWKETSTSFNGDNKNIGSIYKFVAMMLTALFDCD